ncbi:hypothetical protein [Methylocystis parvus]|uniref:hypothetical protein n=1 Tax=Methylocystis parvus TaxID=134 RepID=UPI003C736E22
MKVEVVTPENIPASSSATSTPAAARSRARTCARNAVVINAMVPLANMFGYVNNLRSGTQGRASYTMLFDHYEQVADEVKAKYEEGGPRPKYRSPGSQRTRVANGLSKGDQQWPRKSSHARSRTATSGRSDTSTTARRR